SPLAKAPVTTPRTRATSSRNVGLPDRLLRMTSVLTKNPISPSNLSQVFAGQTVGIKQLDERIWLATFMHYDLGYFDDETCRLEPIANPFGPKVLPMSPE